VQVTFATEPAPGRPNEDLVVAGAGWAAVLDGATAPPGVDSGCVHDVRWLVRHLGAELSRGMLLNPGIPLANLLERAILAVRAAHGPRCDLENPDSPSSTVTLLRTHEKRVDYLVLCDSPLLIEVSGTVQAVLDERISSLPSYTIEGVRAARNHAGGFWVASTDPRAAHEAVQGSCDRAVVGRAALLSDGASRYVARFRLGTWTDLLDLLTKAGPGELIRRVRAAEAQGAGHRGKIHDDATAVLIRCQEQGGAQA
jgi:protein phosphatase 2C-like protein